MKPLRCLLSGCAVVLAAASFSAADDTMRESPWFPLQVGNTWTYRIGDKSFILKVTAHEKVGDVLCARVAMSPLGPNSVPGAVQTFEHLAVTDDGIYRYSINGTRLDKPVRILRLPPKNGDSWAIDAKGPGEVLKGTVKVGEEAEVKVLAGTYKNVFTSTCDDLDANGLHCAFTYYFAQGVGIIKQRVQIEKDATVFELQKFEPAKK